jgi:hypothetical protein
MYGPVHRVYTAIIMGMARLVHIAIMGMKGGVKKVIIMGKTTRV